ncbi:MAG: hypothetical protein NTZ60_02905 [Campylobacterales bacterium]|nr:hypothetical protein [Campylobacterales bacterium]
MELKDVILSTLAEMEDNEVTKKALNNSYNFEVKEMIRPNLNHINTIIKREIQIEPLIEREIQEEVKKETREKYQEESKEESTIQIHENELMYLNSIRERLLVLFEGFQAPNNTNIEAKVDMTLNFLEYVLATIDNRVESLKKGKNSESI